MKINFDRDLLGLDGKAITTPKEFLKDTNDRPILDAVGNMIPTTFEPVKLSVICINALLANKPNEGIEGAKKVERFMLAAKIKQAVAECDVTPEEMVEIKTQVGYHMNTLLAGAALKMLKESE